MDFQIYKLQECGFYDKKNNNSLIFGNIDKWWSDFLLWLSMKASIKDTKTFTYEKDETPSVYCSTAGYIDDIKNINNRYYCISLWNETSSRDGIVQSIPSNSKTNNPTIINNKIKPGSIPGWASNFIYIPTKNFFVSITPNNRFTGRAIGFRQMGNYFRNYLKYHSYYCSFVLSGNEKKWIRGWKEKKWEQSNIYDIRFTLKPLTLATEINKIKGRLNDIEYIVSKNEMYFDKPDHRELVRYFLDKLNIFITQEPESGVKKYTFYTEAPWLPTEADFDHTYNYWNDHSNGVKLGVKFRGERSRIYWFDSAQAKGEKDLNDYELESKTVLNQEDFIKIWTEARESIEAKFPR